ncbi:hypothetical protein STHERM_c18230 [Spirochaeta thermophila DSM 6192]|uniref:Uncharacterized protein n=2 Tax=Winmispira thermophila TaxID=154 RepID=E0RPH6_WINT6|nr:hypothetical protein STHERM_c18230 [Spirochaeta thermophila DSM 6192]
MTMHTRIFVAWLLTVSLMPVFGQDDRVEDLLSTIERVVTVNIATRLEGVEDFEWEVHRSRATLPGKAVTIKLVGKDLVVLARITPFERSDGSYLILAEGQVWTADEGDALRYVATVKEIPLKIGEKVVFFPLGRADVHVQGNDVYHIVMEIWLDGALDEEPQGGAADDALEGAETEGQGEDGG